VSHQDGQSVTIHVRHFLALQAVEVVDEMIHQQRDVVPPLAQRRYVQRYHVQPVVEILAERNPR